MKVKINSQQISPLNYQKGNRVSYLKGLILRSWKQALVGHVSGYHFDMLYIKN